MNTLKLVGMDPSLNNWGVARVTLNLDTMGFHVDGLSVVQTAPEGDKKARKQVRKNSEDLERAKLLHAGAIAAVAGCAIACVEVPVGSQSARSMASYGVCIGVMAAVAERVPLIQVTATEVKLAGCGIRTGTKEEMIEAMMAKYPSKHWPVRTVKGITSPIVSKCEHMADALAAIEAGIATDEFRALVGMMRALRTQRA